MPHLQKSFVSVIVGGVVTLGKLRIPPTDARERSSGATEIPMEIRGWRVMRRLVELTEELRARGIEPRTVHLTLEDEYALFESADDTFGGAGADAANGGVQSFRAFLVIWIHTSAELDVEFDATETQVR